MIVDGLGLQKLEDEGVFRAFLYVGGYDVDELAVLVLVLVLCLKFLAWVSLFLQVLQLNFAGQSLDYFLLHEGVDNADDLDPFYFFLLAGKNAVVCHFEFIFHWFGVLLSTFPQILEHFLEFLVVLEGGGSVVEKGFSAAFLVEYLNSLWREEDKGEVIVGIAQDITLLYVLSFF